MVLGEGGWWAKSGWDCRKVEADSGDFHRSVGDRSVGKVLQLKRWVVVRKKGNVGKEGKGRLQFCGGRIVGWSSGWIGVGTAWSSMDVGAGSQMDGCWGPGC